MESGPDARKAETEGDLSATTAATLLPVRMLNEYVYCPRLFHLMHVEGRWADNADTADGRRVHRRVDRLEGVLPDPDGEAPTNATQTASADAGREPPVISRSVQLGSERLGIVSRLDLVSSAGDEAVPVETKRGKIPDNAQGSWPPERVQLMAQGLLIREHGYVSTHGFLYFAGSRRRVEVPFTAELEAQTLAAIAEARAATDTRTLPAPLEDSPKCIRCSLNGICLPDETTALRAVPEERGSLPVRRLYPARPEARPVYIQEQGAKVGKRGNLLLVRKSGEELVRVHLKDMSQLVLCGNISISAQALHLLATADVPVVHLSYGHWFYAITQGFGLRNAYDRASQFAFAADADRCLDLAKCFIAAKIANQRTLIRRNAEPAPTEALAALKRSLASVAEVASPCVLLGAEGYAARQYFSVFESMLRSTAGMPPFAFKGRNKRPPKDPVNALLSFGYALLAKDCAVALASVGLDPHWGFFHRPRHGRPALALDLMEEFRPIIVDSAVITAINTGMVTLKNFRTTSTGCSLGPKGRKAFIRAYAARMDHLATHPVFDYRCAYRQIVRLQAQLLARFLRGDIPEYRGIQIR